MPSLISESKPVARKPHWCSCCGICISRGTQYVRETYAYDGRIHTYKSCLACHEIVYIVAAWLDHPEDGVNSSDYFAWADEHANYPEHGETARAYLVRAGFRACPTTNQTHRDRCCRTHGTHSVPHKGCILR